MAAARSDAAPPNRTLDVLNLFLADVRDGLGPYLGIGVQALDGIGAGIFGALFPVAIADLTAGTGRFNVAQGAVATTQGLGASLSASVAGAIIVTAGYSSSFLTLAAIAAVGFALYLFAMPETKD